MSSTSEGPRPMHDSTMKHEAQEQTVSEQIGAFVEKLTLDRVPAAIVERAKYLILDAVGCAVAAREEPFALTMSAAAAQLSGDGPRGVIGMAARLPLRDAALVNSMLAHGLDYDDTHTAGVIHLTVSTFPVALAMAARSDATGAALLTAYIAGIETGARIASVAKGGFHRAGFHPTSLVGTFACTLVAGKLLGLSPDGLADAQGIALSLASGSLQFLEDGSWTKRLHPGWAASAGITAASYAQSQIPAPHAAYEGRYGLFRTHLPPDLLAVCDESLATAGLMQRWELEQVAVKPFPACHLLHGCADAAIALHREGIDPQRIRRIRGLVPAGVVQVVCEPMQAKRRPVSDYDAKFSMPYAVACGLLRGRFALDDLNAEAIGDSAIQALMDLVEYAVDDASTYPRHYTGEVIVELDDGSTRRHRVAINRGNAERPITGADIESKFFENFTRTATHEQAQQVLDAILHLDTLPSAARFESLLTLQ